MMSRKETRSAPKNWLLGKPKRHLSTARLPRGLDVLRLVQFHHLEDEKTLPESYKLACEKVISIWQRARIPTQRIDSCVRKLSKLYDKYISLKKSRTRHQESDRLKEDTFRKDLEKLFEIAIRDAMIKISNKEDQEFLCKQRENVFSCSMSGIDIKTTAKESRKRQQQMKEGMVKKRYDQRENKTTEAMSEQSVTSSDESGSGNEYKPMASASSSTRKRSKNIFKVPEVVCALDRVGLPDRSAVFVAGTVAQALGHNLSDITLSRSSIRRSRIKVRQEAATVASQECSFEGPLLLHWDGKMLNDIDGSGALIDRIAIIVTGNGQEKLLGVPKTERGTGECQAKACLDAIQKCNLSLQIKGLVFDTTASNTGLHKGACVQIEKALGTELVWIACRHHVMEIMLSKVFFCLFGQSEGPETRIFKRFKKAWPTINQSTYTAAPDKLFKNSVSRKLRQEMLDYLPQALQGQQPRDDYKEFLYLSLLFLGGQCGNVSFRAPGPTHHARWMGKGIYALKICLFKDQFQIKPKDVKNITDLALFVSLVYIRYWNEAPLAIRAPYNDIELISTLKTYPNQNISSEALSAFSRHQWFLSEHLVALSFFDERVTPETKEKMAVNLQRPMLPKLPRRLKVSSDPQQIKLEDLVTERTHTFFDVLMEEGKRKSQSFLTKHPAKWSEDPIFRELRQRSSRMAVVNDTAERGISLIEKYNNCLTKDEEQLQFLLQLVAQHRKKFPFALKSALMS